MDITVAICTYNGAKDVPEVLDHLRAQEGIATYAGTCSWSTTIARTVRQVSFGSTEKRGIGPQH